MTLEKERFKLKTLLKAKINGAVLMDALMTKKNITQTSNILKIVNKNINEVMNKIYLK